MSITDINSAHGGLIYCIYWHNEDVAEHLFDWHADHTVWLTRCVMSSHIGPQPPAGYTQASGIEWICHKRRRILDLVASSRSVAARSRGWIHPRRGWMRGQKGFRGKTRVGRCFTHTQTMPHDAFQSCLFSLISLFTLKTDQNEQGLVTEHNKNKYMLMTPTKFSDDPCNRSFVFASINMYQARSSTIKFVFCIL